MDFIKKFWYIPLGLFFGIFLLMQSAKKAKMRKRTAKARRTRAKNAKKNKRSSTKAKSKGSKPSKRGKTFRTKPRSQWTNKDKQDWGKWMAAKRRKKK